MLVLLHCWCSEHCALPWYLSGQALCLFGHSPCRCVSCDNLTIQLLMQVETSEVHIPDFDYETISWMLQYMYGCLELDLEHISHPRV